MIRLKKLIKSLLLSLLMVNSIFIHANATSSPENSDENLKNLKSMMPKACHFSGEFIQNKQIKTLPVPLVSEGKFVYSCEFGLIWKTQQPVIESLVFTNKELHFLVSEKQTIENLDGVQHDFLANLLLGLMAGNTDFIGNEFDIYQAKDQQNELTLIPKNKMVKQAISSVILKKLSNANGLEIIISDKNQQTTKIISSEKQQYTSIEDFSKECMTFAANSCEVLLNPIRIVTSGKN